MNTPAELILRIVRIVMGTNKVSMLINPYIPTQTPEED